MTQKKQEPLYFYAKGQQNLQKTLGKQKPINPYTFFTPTSTPNNKPQHSQTKGKFYYDHLILDQQGQKSKPIKKADKRKNYKTKMCPHGLDCRHRFSCTFAHNERELRKPFLKRSKPCKMYQLGQCQLGAACRQYHGNIDLMKKNYKYKSQYCKQFIANGKCSKDRVCIYIHQLPPQQAQEDEDNGNVSQFQESPDKIQQQVIQPSHVKNQQNLKNATSKDAKQIVEIIEQRLGAEQVLQGGLCFNFIS